MKPSQAWSQASQLVLVYSSCHSCSAGRSLSDPCALRGYSWLPRARLQVFYFVVASRARWLGPSKARAYIALLASPPALLLVHLLATMADNTDESDQLSSSTAPTATAPTPTTPSPIPTSINRALTTGIGFLTCPECHCSFPLGATATRVEFKVKAFRAP